MTITWEWAFRVSAIDLVNFRFVDMPSVRSMVCEMVAIPGRRLDLLRARLIAASRPLCVNVGPGRNGIWEIRSCNKHSE